MSDIIIRLETRMASRTLVVDFYDEKKEFVGDLRLHLKNRRPNHWSNFKLYSFPGGKSYVINEGGIHRNSGEEIIRFLVWQEWCEVYPLEQARDIWEELCGIGFEATV